MVIKVSRLCMLYSYGLNSWVQLSTAGISISTVKYLVRISDSG